MELVELLLVEELLLEELLDEVDELLLEDDDPVPGTPSLAFLQPMLKEPNSSKQTICEILGMFRLSLLLVLFLLICVNTQIVCISFA